MALIKEFIPAAGNPRPVKSEVECTYQLVNDLAHGTILYLATLGSAERKLPGKISQSIHLDERRAEELIAIIGEAFPRLNRA